ncbi:MAG: DUF4202 domain-containing protein [Bryobacterales bacterium]|nr:DUF4202 domain-containing protein [Bryobacterales bacterium]
MSNLDEERVRRCMEMFDAANAEDPNRDASGAPKELAYARQMSAWLVRLEPNAPDEVRLAVRAQHIRRWEIPRDSYPAGRSAYLAWRRNLGRFHADTAGAIMRDCGVDDDTVLRVQAIIRKERFKTDRLAQLLEDVACLVFLDHYFAPFAGDQAEDSMVNILRKTWKKMSEAGRAAALQIEYSPQCQALLDEALGND